MSTKAEVGPAGGLAELVPGQILHTTPIVKDCMILSYLPSWKHGNVDNLGVADNRGGVRTLLDWGSEIPDDLIDKNPKWFVALYSRKTTHQPNSGSVKVYGLENEWPEKTSWETRPKTTNEPTSSAMFSSGEGWKLFEVTKLISQQMGRSNGNGVMLRFDVEDKTSEKRSDYQFVSREAAGPWQDKRPVLLAVDVSDEK